MFGIEFVIVFLWLAEGRRGEKKKIYGIMLLAAPVGIFENLIIPKW